VILPFKPVRFGSFATVAVFAGVFAAAFAAGFLVSVFFVAIFSSFIWKLRD
jgi:hypothetical protein